jgi:hypothetical protein
VSRVLLGLSSTVRAAAAAVEGFSVSVAIERVRGGR